MSWPQRIVIYLLGVVLGLLVLWAVKPFGESKEERKGAFARFLDTAHFPYVIQSDAYGFETILAEPATRVVSLAPSITETLYAIGQAEALAGVTEWAEHPPEAKEKPSVGRLDQPGEEAILALEPDLVLATVLTPQPVIERLRGLGLPVITFRHKDWEGVLTDMRVIGRTVGAALKADGLVSELEARRKIVVDAVEEARGLQAGPRVLYTYGLDGLYSAGPGSWPGDLLAMLGARNVAAGAPSAWPQLSREHILEADPEVILWVVDFADKRELATARARVEELPRDSYWGGIGAVEQGRVILLPAGPFNIPGPRMADAFEQMARALYPEAFPEQEGQRP